MHRSTRRSLHPITSGYATIAIPTFSKHTELHLAIPVKAIRRAEEEKKYPTHVGSWMFYQDLELYGKHIISGTAPVRFQHKGRRPCESSGPRTTFESYDAAPFRSAYTILEIARRVRTGTFMISGSSFGPIVSPDDSGTSRKKGEKS